MQRIEESELIINSRGAIYHLDLRPEELADKIFLVGDPGRVPVVSKYFDRIEIKQQHREFVSHTGYIGSERYTVISTGIGTDNIDIVLNELDALVNIDFHYPDHQTRHSHLTNYPPGHLRIPAKRNSGGFFCCFHTWTGD